MRQPLSQYEDEPGYPPGLVADERAEDYGEPPRRRLPMALLTMAVMTIFAGGLYVAYLAGARHASNGGVPLIRADQGPVKVKPEQPGGMDVPDRDKLVYNEKPGGPPVERLLPPPEQPEPRPTAPREPPQAAAPPAAPAPGPAAASGAPSPAPVAAAAAPPRPKRPAADQQQTSAATPASAKPLAVPTPVPQGTKGLGLRIQLAALRTPEAARDEWNRLKRENSDLLGKLSAVAVRADLGDKGVFYRIQAGPFADQGTAEKLCGELKRRKLGCTIAR